jgi:uncharacterized protein
MKLLVTGGTGQIGQKLMPLLVNQGHRLTCLTRDKSRAKRSQDVQQDGVTFLEHNLTDHEIPAQIISEFDGVIHLMGESVDARWSKSTKTKIFDSRVKSSINLVNSVLKIKQSHLKFLISTSAQGIYSDQADRLLVESDDQLPVPSDDFLAGVCRKWEEPFRRLEPKIRTVQLRLPMVLDPDFGALKKLLFIFKKRLGAPLGNGRQWMSWISSDDLIRLIEFVVANETIRGPLNCSAPEPLRNSAFTKVLARRLKVFTLPAVPEVILSLVFGEMSSILLTSTRLSSAQLLDHQFEFSDPKLAPYLQRLRNI